MSNLDCPDDFPKENCPFLTFEKKQVTDQRTDGRTDTPSYRDGWTHLKKWEERNAQREKYAECSSISKILFAYCSNRLGGCCPPF